MFSKVLIANRGEIAVRIARACRELGVRAVAVYSDVDRASLHVRLADEAYPIGPAPSRESYLVIEKILGVARYAGCDAIHPGYGFLAENPALARACVDAGITFIGPSAAAMEQLGSKTAARQIAREVGAPTVPGTLDPIKYIGRGGRNRAANWFPRDFEGGGRRRGQRHAQHRDARANSPPPGAMPRPKRKTRSATRGCTSKNISSALATSRSRYSRIITEILFISASANVPCSAATRK